MAKKQKNAKDSVNKLYKNLNNPLSFTSPSKISKKTKIKKSEIVEKLKIEPSYYLHKKITRVFPRRRVIVSHPNHQYAIDLKDVKEYSETNNNTKYLFCAVDCFSRFAFVEPMKDKKAETSEKALALILKRIKHPIRKLWADRYVCLF